MEIIKKKQRNDVHPYIPELEELYRAGRCSRREFMRTATLLGMSAAAASALAACAPSETATPEAAPPTEAPEPTPAPPSGPKRGGTLHVSAAVHKVTHPAQFSWVSPSNQLRQVSEYLTLTDHNNVTHPYLLESWDASDDLLTWTLNLRQGIKFNNGDEFNADDVIFTMNEWLNPDVESSILGLMSYLQPTGIEKVDDHTVKLHLDKAEIAVPEHLFHYPALVLNHRTFEGDFLKAPHGTGPYTMEEYIPDERVLVKRRTDYWQMGKDGDPLPYLDEIEWTNLGEEMSAHIAALQAGEIDQIDVSDVGGTDIYLALKDDPNVNIFGTPTGQTRLLRMRVDVDPWTDNNVRKALKLCQNREKILQLAYFGEGVLGHDCHVSPIHPEFCPMDPPVYDPEQAKELLAEAGYPDGLDVELAVSTGWADVVKYAEVLKEDAAAAGFNITLNTMPTSQYWELWTEVDLGITPWTHRPLGTMVLNLAYIADENGDPVPWNETRWVDEEFSELLEQANATLDVEERREIMCDLQRIQIERGSIGTAWWRNIWFFVSKKFQNVNGHPTAYLLFNEVWYDPEA
ncbi:MAG: ABC transporter substrate-binding protein [Chloroflexota bacterium]|nr:ABC transporter substrate-binding protein [Chloroflexota bacterium]